MPEGSTGSNARCETLHFTRLVFGLLDFGSLHSKSDTSQMEQSMPFAASERVDIEVAF